MSLCHIEEYWEISLKPLRSLQSRKEDLKKVQQELGISESQTPASKECKLFTRSDFVHPSTLYCSLHRLLQTTLQHCNDANRCNIIGLYEAICYFSKFSNSRAKRQKIEERGAQVWNSKQRLSTKLKHWCPFSGLGSAGNLNHKYISTYNMISHMNECVDERKI